MVIRIFGIIILYTCSISCMWFEMYYKGGLHIERLKCQCTGYALRIMDKEVLEEMVPNTVIKGARKVISEMNGRNK